MTEFTTWRSLVDGAEFSVIPDTEDLHFRYDFSEEDGSMPVADLSNNGHDLGNGSYSGTSAEINGLNSGDFDGDSDGIHGNIGSLEPPFHDFFVLRWDQLTDGDYAFADTDDNHPSMRENSDEWAFRADNNDMVSTTYDTEVHIIEVLWADENRLVIDGTEEDTLSETPNTATDFGLGYASFSDDRHSDITVGELLRYDRDKTDSADDIRQYLGNKWGIGLS